MTADSQTAVSGSAPVPATEPGPGGAPNIKTKIILGVLCILVVGLYWMQWEYGKEVKTVQMQWDVVVSNITVLTEKQTQFTVNQSQFANILVQLIVRTGNTNMLGKRP